jgi:hypothetical protein
METSIETRSTEMKKKLQKVFDKKRANVLTEVITDAYRDLLKTSDFNELKDIVKDLGIKVGDLAEAQKRTELRMEELAGAQKGLTEAQKRTEVSVATLARGLDATRTELGGLSRSVSYSLENEAYRRLPSFLKERYQIEVTEKIIRLELEEEEINVFAHGRRDGKEILIVGEAELRLSSVGKLKQLEKKVSLVKRHYPGECIPLVITHFARQPVLDTAKERGIIVIQSFEW